MKSNQNRNIELFRRSEYLESQNKFLGYQNREESEELIDQLILILTHAYLSNRHEILSLV